MWWSENMQIDWSWVATRGKLPNKQKRARRFFVACRFLLSRAQHHLHNVLVCVNNYLAHGRMHYICYQDSTKYIFFLNEDIISCTQCSRLTNGSNSVLQAHCSCFRDMYVRLHAIHYFLEQKDCVLYMQAAANIQSDVIIRLELGVNTVKKGPGNNYRKCCRNLLLCLCSLRFMESEKCKRHWPHGVYGKRGLYCLPLIKWNEAKGRGCLILFGNQLSLKPNHASFPSSLHIHTFLYLLYLQAARAFYNKGKFMMATTKFFSPLHAACVAVGVNKL
jgi:hypothetical protein